MPGEGNDFSLRHSVQTYPGAQSAPPIQREFGVVFPQEKGPGREADNSLPSSAKMKNVGAIFPIPRTSLLRGA
jgi:hypothetical protein